MDSVLATLLILGTPAMAVAGGILAGILKMRGQQRLLELAQRERILAIEKGLDLSQLTPIVPVSEHAALTSRQLALRKAQGLMIGGVLTLALGIGLSATMLLLPASDGRESWSIGFVPALLGIALLISGRIVRSGIEEQ